MPLAALLPVCRNAVYTGAFFKTEVGAPQHGAIHLAMAADDNTPAGAPKPYGVRSLRDWRDWASKLETELAARNADEERAAGADAARLGRREQAAVKSPDHEYEQQQRGPDF